VTSGEAGIANQIAHKCFERGLVIETSGANDEVLKVLPSLTISDGMLKHGLEILERCVGEVLAATGTSAHVLKFGGKRR
jgi:diaminobutyrate-2-oxoglutarate transaminase